MKTNLSILSGMIIGSILTVLAIFLIKPAFLNTDSSIAVSDNEIHDSQELSSEEDSEDIEVPCDDNCVDTIIEDLIAGKNLSNEYGIAIRESNAIKAAKKLETQPETVEKILAKLRSLEGQDDRDAILFTFSYLPIEKIEKINQSLLSSENVQDRSDALSMVYHVANVSDKTVGILRNVIKNDTNDELAIDAIQILADLHPDQVGDVSRQKLNQLLSSETPEELRSSALETKTHLFETNDEIKQDIMNALNSSEQRFREIGIQTLDSIMSRQSNGNAAGDWRSDEDIRKTIESIANNPNAAPFTRVEALNLMRRHYFN